MDPKFGAVPMRTTSTESIHTELPYRNMSDPPKMPLHPEAPAVPKHVAMSWAQRLKRVFAIEIDTCARCQGRLRVIASLEEP
jgi:hypothetical protein